MASPVRSDRCYRFDVEPEQLWERLTAIEEYRTWWPWLRRLDAEGFRPGATWRCTVQPPLPYTLRFDVELTTVEEHSLVVARLRGDIVGGARLELDGDGDGAHARLVSSLAPASRSARLVTRLAQPVARFGHDWVLDTGARQFRERALPGG